MLSLREELEQRGFVNQFTNEALFDSYERGGEKFYCGYDPTADSLHLWNLVTIMAAVNFMKKWNIFYLLIWWATGMIGDPGGKDAEREFLDEKVLRHNQKAITKQVHDLLDNLKKLSWKEFTFKVINNYDFYKDMSVLEFLRNVGKYITVNTMIAKDIVKKRVEYPENSISYTEFSDTLLQWNDFLKLYREKDVRLQLSGSDQWGNITTGTELVRKLENQEVYGFTVPLILDSRGKKFGKSEGNAIWIDRQKNSPYFVYQFFMNTSDEDVSRFLKLFSLLELDEIDKIVSKHMENPSLRFGQKTLADYVVTSLFGEKFAQQAQRISQLFFGEGNVRMETIATMSKEDLKALGVETGMIHLSDIQDETRKLLDFCSHLGISKSNGEAKKLIQSGSIFLNENKVDDIQKVISDEDFVNGAILLRKWKKTFRLILR